MNEPIKVTVQIPKITLQAKTGIEIIQYGTLTIGKTTTLAPGEEATVSNSGTVENAVLNFSIPKGQDGKDGKDGKDGLQGVQGPPGEIAGLSGIATTKEAIAGESDIKAMTPLKTKEAVAAQVPEIIQVPLQGKADLVDGKVPTDQLPGETYTRLDLNYVPADTTNKGWNALGVASIYYTQDKIANQPSTYGQLINFPADKGNEAMQIWLEQPNGNVFVRSGNAQEAINDKKFRRLAIFSDSGHLVLPNGAEFWIG